MITNMQLFPFLKMLEYGIQLEFCQVFQLTIYPYIFHTEPVGKNAAKISGFLEAEDP